MDTSEVTPRHGIWSSTFCDVPRSLFTTSCCLRKFRPPLAVSYGKIKAPSGLGPVEGELRPLYQLEVEGNGSLAKVVRAIELRDRELSRCSVTDFGRRCPRIAVEAVIGLVKLLVHMVFVLVLLVREGLNMFPFLLVFVA